MKKSPAFQFYPNDWLSSPSVAMMSPEYEGAYIRLLCYCWASGDCSIEDNDELLSRLSRLFQGWFNGGSTVVRKCFIPHPQKDGFLTNKRLLDEMHKQTAWRAKSSNGGKKSVQKRIDNKQDFKGGSKMVEPKLNSSSSSSSSNISNKLDIEVETEVSPLKPKVKNKGSRIPVDWELSVELGEWAMSQGLTRDDVLREEERFKDHWTSLSGTKAIKLDWDATFRNWIRNHIQWGKK